MASRRVQWVLLGCIVIVAVGIRTLAYGPWFVRNAGGKRCVVRRGQTVADLFQACGLPDRSGTQPKAGGGSLLSLKFCSAPGYVYGNDAVLMTCDGLVGSVGSADARAYEAPRTYRDPDPQATRRQKNGEDVP